MRGLGREAARHGAGDERGPVLLQPLDELSLLRNERVDAFRLPVEVFGSNGALLIRGVGGGYDS